MSKFNIEYTESFSDSVVIEADSEEEAERLFWRNRFADRTEIDEFEEIA
jgi:hypothetical protein